MQTWRRAPYGVERVRDRTAARCPTEHVSKSRHPLAFHFEPGNSYGVDSYSKSKSLNSVSPLGVHPVQRCATLM